MIKLRIRIPGRAEKLITVPGDEALIGRNPDCDVILPGPFVSKYHAKIINGVGIVDIASTNGVWVRGAQIKTPSILRDAVFHLGSTPDTSPSIEVLEVSSAAGGNPEQLALLKQELEQVQVRNQQLEKEVVHLRSEIERQRPQLEEDGDATLLIMPSDPGTDTVAEDAPEAITPATPPPASAPDPVAVAPQEGVPSFSDFFNVAPAAIPEPTPVPATRPAVAPVPAQVPAPIHSPATSRDRVGIMQMIDGLVRDDVGDHLPIIQGPIEEFFTLESFRLLRQVERVITRLAREFKQLYDMTTMLPDSEGNFRSLAAEVLMDPDNGDQRQRLVDYLDDLRRWLGVSLAANRKAATRFVVELKRDLSEEGLALDEPVPSWMKALGKDSAEYWRRVQDYLKGLDEDKIEERLEKYAKEFAIEVMEGNQASGDAPYH